MSCKQDNISRQSIQTATLVSTLTEDVKYENSNKTVSPQPSQTASNTLTPTTSSITELEMDRNLGTEVATPTITGFNDKEVIFVQDRLNAGTYFYVHPDLRGATDYLSSDQILASPGPKSPGSGYLSFSNFDTKIAYFDLEDNVWIDNLTNTRPIKVYSYKGNGNLSVQLTWTPDDKHLILDFNNKTIPNMIYHLNSAKLEEWDYVCDRLATSPRTQKVAIWCISTKSGGNYAIVEWGGNIWYNNQPPKKDILRSISMKEDYRFRLFPLYRNVGWSSSGALFAYFNPQDKTGALQIANVDGKVTMQLSQKAYWLSGLYKKKVDLPGVPIQWSKSGDRLLVFSVGDSQNPCPTLRIEVGSLQGDYPNPGCWQVYDSKTGEKLWISANLSSTGDYYFDLKLGEATLSEDGKMIALFAYVNGYNPKFFVLYIDKNKILQVAPFTVEKLRWGPID